MAHSHQVGSTTKKDVQLAQALVYENFQEANW